MMRFSLKHESYESCVLRAERVKRQMHEQLLKGIAPELAAERVVRDEVERALKAYKSAYPYRPLEELWEE